jgi:serine/threonine protein kinase
MPTPFQIKTKRLTQEQVGQYDRSVDVWAVGVLAFECLTGVDRMFQGFGGGS